MKTSQAIGIVAVGTLLFQIADIGKSVYLRGRDVSDSQRIQQQQSPAEIDRANREQAKDYAFLYNNPSLEEPMYQKLTKTTAQSGSAQWATLNWAQSLLSLHSPNTIHHPPNTINYSDISPIDPRLSA